MSLNNKSRISCIFKAFSIWILIFVFGNLIGGMIRQQVDGLVYAIISIQIIFTASSTLAAIILFKAKYRDLMGLRPQSGPILKVIAISFASSLPMTYLINILASTSHQIQLSILFLIPITLILAPIGEEFLFRGLLLGCLIRCIGRWPAIIISSIVFALAHLSAFNAYLMTPLTIFLILVGASILRLIAGHFKTSTNSLIPAIIAHSIFNFSGMVTGIIINLSI